jgi:RNA:NAD 2'-phosphotransferase (TPT1/KptA family)
MTDTDVTRMSKHLSYLLRHNPGAIGLTLDDGGWINIDTLLSAARSNDYEIDLGKVLDASGKRRFEVGARRGRPVVLVIDAGTMHREGREFYRTATGVWLTAHVPPSAILREDPPRS